MSLGEKKANRKIATLSRAENVECELEAGQLRTVLLPIRI